MRLRLSAFHLVGKLVNVACGKVVVALERASISDTSIADWRKSLEGVVPVHYNHAGVGRGSLALNLPMKIRAIIEGNGGTNLIAARGASMENPPVWSIPTERAEDAVPDFFDDGEIDIEGVRHGSSEAAPIWNLGGNHRLDELGFRAV